MRKLISLVAILAAGFVYGLFYGYDWGISDGRQAGRREVLAEKVIEKSEYDREMQQAGLCKWVKLMADDVRCKAELP